MATVAQIWRHPIKSHGREPLASVELAVGQTMPWDRTWAVAHEAAKTAGTEWAHCANFSRVAKAPALMAIEAQLDEARETLTLSHPDLPDLRFHPDSEPEKLIEWARPLMPDGRMASARIVRVPGRGMTDTDFPSISLGNLSSHRAVEQKLGRKLSAKRWRGNIWLDGLAPWEEFDWIGRTIRIGAAELKIEDRTTRCLATTANPATGVRDADTLGVLQDGWGHKDFCVYAVVTKSGRIALGDCASVL